MAKKTIWCLNMAANILGSHVNEIENEFGKDNVCFGDRTLFDDPKYAKLNTDSPINLMTGVEYFVPIAPKCLGDSLNNPTQADLKAIKDYYKGIGQESYDYFWSDECYKSGYRMITPQFEGYYKILEKTAPNILVGYSQGGLVAKYLAWLDEKVFKKGYVDSVITISSPNFGSPVANPENKKYVFKGLMKIAAVILFDKHHLGILDMIEKKHNENQDGFINDDTIDKTHGILNEILEKLEAECDGIYQDLKDLINTIKNWLGGLNNKPNDAFIDLNIFRLYDSPSVLSSINSGSSIWQEGIISTDNKLKDILHPQAARLLHGILKNNLMSANSTDDDLENLKDLAGNVNSDSINIDYEKIEHIYNTEIMVEHHSNKITDKRITDTIKDYNDGINNLKILPNAHDFIIPSAYQLTYSASKKFEEINHPNFDANHLTGSDSVKYKAGEENYQMVLKMLREIL